jgi:hypothetical protein
MFIRNSFILCAPCVFFLVSLIGPTGSWGQETPGQSPEPSSDFSIPEAIKGFDEEKVKNDPVCDSSVRPEITQVEPDEMAAGDTIVVQGKSFGKKKECLHSVAFGSEEAKTFSYVNDERIEATVPEGVRSGVTFLNITTGGGSARKGILITSKE